jgi:tetratricopeptide (TPR) repeat protein
LPLALAIVAGRLAYEPGWSTADFLSRMQTDARRLKELQSEDQNVRLSFTASYELLPGEVQPFFDCLSHFGGEDFSPTAAAAAAGILLEDAQDYLRTLYRLSLVQSGRAGRYRLHPLLRDYAREKLPDDTSWTPLVEYFLDFIEAHPAGDPALALEGDNISAVILGAQANGETAASLDLLIVFTPYLKMQGLYTAAQQKLAAGLFQGGEEQRLPILLQLSQIARYFRRYVEAEGYLEAAVSLAKPESAEMSAILNERGIIAGCRGDYTGAREHFRAGLALAREDGRPALLIPLLKESGAAEIVFGEYETAESLYEESLVLARQTAPLHIPALLRCLAGIAVIRDRDFEGAETLYQDGLAQARTMNSREDIISLLNNLAAVAFEQGHFGRAKGLLDEGLALARTLLHPAGEAMIVGNMGRLAAHEKQWEQARVHLETAVAVAEGAKHLELTASLRRSLELLAGTQMDAGEKKQLAAQEPVFPERLKIFYD